MAVSRRVLVVMRPSAAWCLTSGDSSHTRRTSTRDGLMPSAGERGVGGFGDVGTRDVLARAWRAGLGTDLDADLTIVLPTRRSRPPRAEAAGTCGVGTIIVSGGSRIGCGPPGSLRARAATGAR
jgi:hypothetical protein